MDRMILSLFALLSFYIGFVYLFRRDLAARWDSSRKRALGRADVVRDKAWEAGATRRGASALVVGVLLLAIVTGVL